MAQALSRMNKKYAYTYFFSNVTVYTVMMYSNSAFVGYIFLSQWILKIQLLLYGSL